MIVHNKNIEIYIAENGKSPFIEWLESLEKPIRYRVKERLDRVSLGNLGDWKSVGEGVAELRLSFGSGYRIYFGQEGNTLILLLCGGDKATQEKDIRQAQQYWKGYLSR